MEGSSEGPAKLSLKKCPEDFDLYSRACRILLQCSYPVNHTLICPEVKTKKKKKEDYSKGNLAIIGWGP